MRVADASAETQLTTVKVEDFVPAAHPLSPIRQWLDESIAKMDANSSAVYATYVKGGRPSIAPENLMREMPLQVPYSSCSELQLSDRPNTTSCSAGSLAWPSRTRCGTTPSSARTTVRSATPLRAGTRGAAGFSGGMRNLLCLPLGSASDAPASLAVRGGRVAAIRNHCSALESAQRAATLSCEACD